MPETVTRWRSPFSNYIQTGTQKRIAEPIPAE